MLSCEESIECGTSHRGCIPPKIEERVCCSFLVRDKPSRHQQKTNKQNGTYIVSHANVRCTHTTCVFYSPFSTLDDTNKMHGAPAGIVQYKHINSRTMPVISIKLGLPHVKVAGDSHAVAVSGKVVPLVHINPILLVVHNLIHF